MIASVKIIQTITGGVYTFFESITICYKSLLTPTFLLYDLSDQRFEASSDDKLPP